MKIERKDTQNNVLMENPKFTPETVKVPKRVLAVKPAAGATGKKLTPVFNQTISRTPRMSSTTLSSERNEKVKNLEIVTNEMKAAIRTGKLVRASNIADALLADPDYIILDNGIAMGPVEVMRSNSIIWDQEIISQRLMKETAAQGIRNFDLAKITGWPASKVSKITSGKQKATQEDIKTWAMVLGYMADAFVSREYDLRDYRWREYVRSVRDCLDAGFCRNGVKDQDVLQFELPLSILGTVGVRVSDYIIRTASGKDVSYSDEEKPDVSSVTFCPRNLFGTGSLCPGFGCWIEPEEGHLILGTVIYGTEASGHGGREYDQENGYGEQEKGHREDIVALRKRTKELTGVPESDTRKFDDAIKEWKQVPEGLDNLEIASVTYSLYNLPDKEELEADIHRIFTIFCDVAWEMAGTDLAPIGYREAEQERMGAWEKAETVGVQEDNEDRENETMSPYDIYNALSGTGAFSWEVVEEVRKEQSFACEIDETHLSFTDDRGTPYMEVVPLVPFGQVMNYGKKVFKKENGLCLCPVCSSQLFHGTREDREDMLFRLYRKHSGKLKEAGIDISLAGVLGANGL